MMLQEKYRIQILNDLDNFELKRKKVKDQLDVYQSYADRLSFYSITSLVNTNHSFLNDYLSQDHDQLLAITSSHADKFDYYKCLDKKSEDFSEIFNNIFKDPSFYLNNEVFEFKEDTDQEIIRNLFTKLRETKNPKYYLLIKKIVNDKKSALGAKLSVLRSKIRDIRTKFYILKLYIHAFIAHFLLRFHSKIINNNTDDDYNLGGLALTIISFQFKNYIRIKYENYRKKSFN